MKASNVGKISQISLFGLLIALLNPASLRTLNELDSTHYSTLSAKLLLNFFVIVSFYICINIFSKVITRAEKIYFLINHSKTITMFSLGVFAVVPAFISTEFFVKFYQIFGIGHVSPNFLDLRGTLAAIKKVSGTGDSYSVSCLPIEQPCPGWRWTYGSLILQLKHISFFDEKNTLFFALITIVFWLIYFRHYLNQNISYLYVLPLIFSGTFLIIFERLNLDSFLPLIFFYLTRQINTTNKLKFCWFFLYLFFSQTKYYSFVVLPFLFFYEKDKKNRILFLLLSFPFIIKTYVDLKQAGLDAINFGYSATFGLQNIIGIFSNSQMPTFKFNLFAYFFVLLLIILLLYGHLKLYKKIEFNRENLSQIQLFTIGTITFIFSWLAASNYPYRLTVILCVIPLIISERNFSIQLKTYNICLIYFTFALPHATFTVLRNVFCLILICNLLTILVIRNDFNLNYSNGLRFRK